MKNRTLFIIVALVILISLVNVYASDGMPQCVKNAEGKIEITGQLDRKYAGSQVLVLLVSKDGNEETIGHIGQASVKADGSYKHSFSLNGSISDYKLRVNAGGKLIDDSVIDAKYEAMLDIDLNLAKYIGFAVATTRIVDKYGAFFGEGTEYSCYIAAYDLCGKLLSVSKTDQSSVSAEAVKHNLLLNIPAEAYRVKAFIWKDITPLINSEEKLDSEEPDSINSRGDVWEPVNMVSSGQKKAGYIGGEGGQRIMSIAVSSDDSLILCGNDTGGLNRSADGGKTWEDCFNGFYCSGATAIAIDPKNKERVLVAGTAQRGNASGMSTSIQKTNGLYLSEDGGYSWKQVLNQPGAVTFFDMREAISYDVSSYDKEKGYCTTAYWSRPWRLQFSGGKLKDNNSVVTYDGDLPGLWKTTDGGITWENVNTEMSDGVVKVNPSDGSVYVANPDGVHVSRDGGRSFVTAVKGMCLGIDVISSPGYENYVWINNSEGVRVSTDGGNTFKLISDSTYPSDYDTTHTDTDKISRYIKVSPKNPKQMVLGWYNGSNYKSARYYTTNGGVTWYKGTYLRTVEFFLSNNRHPVFAWSNLTAGKVWSTGGDWITISNDGGRTYKWNYDGGGDVHVDQRTIFNVYNPDIFYYGSQDFHGAITTDGGNTWKHIWKFASQAYARVYGAYAADENTLIAIVYNDDANKRLLKISRDGGETWTDTGCEITGRGWCKWSEICYQSPTDKNVLFAANWRSDDYGQTWSKMSGVHSVNCHNPHDEKEIYGTYYNKIRVSYDSGANWKDYATVPSSEGTDVTGTQIWDIAYDGISKTMYFVSGNSGSGQIFGKVSDGVVTDLTDNLNGHEIYGKSFQLCAVDPNVSGIVYVGGYASIMNPDGVQRSTDGGNTFYTLTTSGEENSVVKKGPAGGLNPYDIIVHPVTGEIWVAQGCNGWAKFPPPY